MKKTFAVFVLFVGAALPVFSASTCETRVDKHPDATTKERVSYCLTPEAEPPAPAGAELVYYGVSGSEPQDASARDERYKQKYFDKNGVAVAQDYVGTRQFPAFTNNALSEQERMALEQAEKEAWAKNQEEADKKAAAKNQPPASAAQDEREPEMSKAQLAARKNKPKRFMKESAPEPESAAQAYSSDTPVNELQQAQALENDPLSSSSGNAGGGAPNGFLDDSLLDDPSFGYNASDPAMQP